MGSEMNADDVSKYLQENADFLKSWLLKHGNKDMLESVKMCIPDLKEKNESGVVSGVPTSKTSPGMSGLKSTSMFKSYVESLRFHSKRSLVTDRETLTKMTQKDMFMELIRDISSELNVNVLCHKILQNVSILTKCDRGSLFLVRGTKDSKLLVSKLFDVTQTSTLEESVSTEESEIKVPFGKGIVGHVALTKETINIREAYEDPRFNQDIDRKTGYRTHSILSMPIVNREDETIGVAQIINKVSGDHEFTRQDEEVFKNYLTFCGIGLVNAQLFEMSVIEYKRNQMLLNLARGIFEEQSNLEKLIQKVMVDAQDLLKCERCSVYLLEEGKTVVFSKAFELYAKAKGTIHVPSAVEIAKSKDAEMAKYVVLKGTSINIADLVLDGRFGPGPEILLVPLASLFNHGIGTTDFNTMNEFINTDGFQTVSMLCMPIFNNEKKIIGICQLVNKLNYQPFNENDINIIEAFSIFCGLGIHNCQMYENACKLMAKQSVALEVLSYHACAQPDEVEKIMSVPLPDVEAISLYSFDFDDIALTDDDTVRTVISMFMEADLLDQYRVPKEVLGRWACSVKKNYRPVIYHNWRHAFNVTQSMFCMLMTGGIRNYLDDLEMFTLLAACLCHDLDHRGTNNAFQVKAESPLAMLYSTSTMEHHHFDHCVMILNSEGNNIFANLSSDDYRRVVKMLESAILSTDLALYFKKRGNFKQLIDSGDVSFDGTEKKELLKAMMMTACDVAAICKPWEIQQRVANLVASEFFDQGDMEKQKLNQAPIAMMDREKSDDLPKMQVGFINAICLPVYQLFSEVSVKCSPLFDGCLHNRDCWQNLVNQSEARCIKAGEGEKNPDSTESSPATKTSPAIAPASSQKSTVTSTITTKVTVTTQKRVKADSNGTSSKLTKTPAVQKPQAQSNNQIKSRKKMLPRDPKSALCLLQ